MRTAELPLRVLSLSKERERQKLKVLTCEGQRQTRVTLVRQSMPQGDRGRGRRLRILSARSASKGRPGGLVSQDRIKTPPAPGEWPLPDGSEGHAAMGSRHGLRRKSIARRSRPHGVATRLSRREAGRETRKVQAVKENRMKILNLCMIAKPEPQSCLMISESLQPRYARLISRLSCSKPVKWR